MALPPTDGDLRDVAQLTTLGLAQGRLPFPIEAVIEALGADKKHAGGHLRWVLATGTGVVIRADVPLALVSEVIGELLEPAAASAGGGSTR